MNMEKIWIRLGGYIEGSPELMSKVMDGDSKALIDAIRINGITLDGDSYIPDEHGDIVAEFDIYPPLKVR